jgi:hypothetical protein
MQVRIRAERETTFTLGLDRELSFTFGVSQADYRATAACFS